jgi:uncharacterized protein YtpQ (UPF0354 family)
MFLRALSRIAVFAMFGAPALATGQSLPLDRQSFTNYVADRIKTVAAEDAQAKFQVTVMRPLAIHLTSESGMGVETNLRLLHTHCVALEGRCADAIARFVQAAFEVFGQATSPIERNMLRALVKPAAYVSEVDETHKQRGLAIVAKPYVGELWMILVIHRANLVSVATMETLKQLGLDEASGFDLALKNTAALKGRALDRAVPLRGTHFETLNEDEYESSRLLMHADWAEVAKARGGDLIVSVPASNALIFGSIRNTDQMKNMRNIVSQEAHKARRFVSSQMFRWRTDGWELVEDPGDLRAQIPPSTNPVAPIEVRPVTTSAQ